MGRVPLDYQWIWDKYMGRSPYHSVKGAKIISTFSSGGFKSDTWGSWKQGMKGSVYFIPDFDDTEGYYKASEAWWGNWGPVLDGVSSWESAWPQIVGSDPSKPGDVSKDEKVLTSANGRDKGYMIGLSPLQYKNAFITFNDGPEAHYIGNLWPEAGTDDASSSYANMDQWSHDGWRPLVKSFNEAFASGAPASEMNARGDAVAIGAAWFKTILVDSVDCNNDTKPDGFDQGKNGLHWAVVLDPKAGAGYNLTVAGDKTQSVPLNPGLNYGSSEGGLQAGAQIIELHDPSGQIVMTATGGMCVSTEFPSGIYNSNYQVVELTDGSQPAKCQEI
ncbi:hypothetical protein FJTKL_13817 [Diaporthe vaccinii]|uniref:Uncharacterized protein n=1 Tax=Diaporthe vaccinii TaxID=105482 RepID=A0ABR4F8Y0_9PEZI